MKNQSNKLTATQARELAKEIALKCSDCFPTDKVRAQKQFGQWVIKINGGREACYGKTVNSEESAQDLISVFQNDAK